MGYTVKMFSDSGSRSAIIGWCSSIDSLSFFLRLRCTDKTTFDAAMKIMRKWEKKGVRQAMGITTSVTGSDCAFLIYPDDVVPNGDEIN